MGGCMTTVRQYLVFLTGHRISARTPAEEVGSLSKIGAAIAFASFLAALQFGIAGWFLAMDLHIVLQILMALIFAVIGAAIVLVLDRNFIYLADTRYETDKKLTYVYLGIRVLFSQPIKILSRIILFIPTITIINIQYRLKIFLIHFTYSF